MWDSTRWVPTLDGEQVPYFYSHYFTTREEAWAEAIKRVKHHAGLAFELMIDSRAGCVLVGEIPVIVQTVAEAREVLVRRARGELSGYTRDPRRREHLRFQTRRGRSAWKSLLECETSRRYDPADAAAGMTCSYLLYEEGDLAGVGGLMWTYSVELSATGPPEVWDHPADQPVGLDNDDHSNDDLEDD